MNPILAFTSSPEQTERVAAEFAARLLGANETDAFLAFYGDLGAGKTAFVRGLASVFVPHAEICSPTFSIVNEYEGENNLRFCHFDMYRITSEEDLYSIGFYDYENCICAVEWSENIEFALPSRYYRIEIRKEALGDTNVFDNGKRRISIEEIIT